MKEGDDDDPSEIKIRKNEKRTKLVWRKNIVFHSQKEQKWGFLLAEKGFCNRSHFDKKKKGKRHFTKRPRATAHLHARVVSKKSLASLGGDLGRHSAIIIIISTFALSFDASHFVPYARD